MSTEALALEISHVVSRVLRGEAIDTAENGAKLAAKYPDLGMSGPMIGEAISRAASMVGMIKNQPEPPFPPPRVRSFVPPPQPVDKIGDGPAVAAPLLANEAPSIDDSLAASIDAEIGNLVAGWPPERADLSRKTEALPAPDGEAARTGRRFGKGAVARVRRALFRH